MNTSLFVLTRQAARTLGDIYGHSVKLDFFDEISRLKSKTEKD